MTACFKFVNDLNGMEFTACEGDAVYARVTGYDRADNTCLGECDCETGELIDEATLAKAAAKAEKEAAKAAKAAEAAE